MRSKVKPLIIVFISYLLVFLFVYAATSKMLEFQNFQAQLGQSPLVSAYTGFVSYAVLAIELGISVVLVIPKKRFLGLLASFCLMVMFTTYITVILNFSSFIPCSCGGILEDLNWKEHLIFNGIITITAALGVYLSSTSTRKILLYLLSLGCFSAMLIIGLYLASENTMHRENPFIRRFIQGTAIKTAEINLDNNSKYFTGSDEKIIYLGDNKAPLHIIRYDSTLKIKKHHKIELESESFPFQSVQVRVAPPYFYLMDGTVPVIFKGNIADWKAKLWMHNNNYYFSKAEIISKDKIVFRAQELKTHNNILGTFTKKDSLTVNYAPTILQKQLDGFFDTDGIINVDRKNQNVIYTYYYRNEFSVSDRNLKLLHRNNTIDTTTTAKLKIAHIKETGQKKIASLPATVNQITAYSNNILFINSKVIGRYESRKMWKEASIIDMYNCENGDYISSLYIYHANKAKVREIFVIEDNLYAIIGHQLHKYKLNIKKQNK